MASPTGLILASALSLTVQAAGMALADDAPRQASIALIDKPWAVSLDITGYRVLVDGIKPDSRRYFLATNDATAMHLSVTLEAVSGPATEQGCLAHLTRIARTTDLPLSLDLTPYEVHQIPILEYLLPRAGDPQRDELHLFACTSKDNVYTDIHLSKTGARAGDDSQLRDVLGSLTIVAATKPSSLDHFRAGSAPYLQGQLKQAIPHYEQAVALEQANPSLDKSLWRLLIHNLGMAYGRTGDFAHAKKTFDYGLSQDPANPFFYYDLARIYAGLNDREKAMQALHNAFLHSRRSHEGDPIPDPRQDVSFGRFMLDPAFRTLAESLMQPAI